MSGHVDIVLRIDPVPPEDAAALATRLAGWLLERGIVQPSTKRGRDRTRYEPGPAWRDAVEREPRPHVFLELPHNGVEIDHERGFHGGPAEMPQCGRCGTELPGAQFGEEIEAWLADAEPMTTCSTCGWSAPFGDWPCDDPSGYVGAPAIYFHNWPELADGFLSELTEQLGGRCRTVSYKH